MIGQKLNQQFGKTFLSLQSVLTIGTTLFGGPFSGWLADTAGARTPFIFGGIVCMASALFGYWATKRYIPQAIVKSEIMTIPLENPEER